MTRGISHSRDMWKKFMETQMFNFRQKPLLKDAQGNFIPDGVDANGQPKYKSGEETIARVQGALRPIELWEYVFPQESLQEVLAMMEMHKTYDKLRPEVQNYAWIMRKLTGAKKIPDMPELKKKESWEVTQKHIPMLGMCAYPLGIKEDNVQDYIFGNDGFHQEGL